MPQLAGPLGALAAQVPRLLPGRDGAGPRATIPVRGAGIPRLHAERRRLAVASAAEPRAAGGARGARVADGRARRVERRAGPVAPACLAAALRARRARQAVGLAGRVLAEPVRAVGAAAVAALVARRAELETRPLPRATSEHARRQMRVAQPAIRARATVRSGASADPLVAAAAAGHDDGGGHEQQGTHERPRRRSSNGHGFPAGHEPVPCAAMHVPREIPPAHARTAEGSCQHAGQEACRPGVRQRHPSGQPPAGCVRVFMSRSST